MATNGELVATVSAQYAAELDAERRFWRAHHEVLLIRLWDLVSELGPGSAAGARISAVINEITALE